jgi:hypothetical protein
MSHRAICLFGGVLAGLWLLAGCTPDDYYNNRDSNAQNNGPTNGVPTSLAGRSYTFTVTGSQGFPEEFNSGYTIDFQSETAYLLHPTPQKDRLIRDEHGSYLFDSRSGVVHFVEEAPVTGRTFDAALTFNSPNSGTAHLTGANGQSQDVIFFQTVP